MRAEGPLGFKRVEVAGSRSRVAPILEVDSSAAATRSS